MAIWWTIWIPYILNHKQAFSVRFSEHHSNTGLFDYRTHIYHSNTRIVRYSDGYCITANKALSSKRWQGKFRFEGRENSIASDKEISQAALQWRSKYRTSPVFKWLNSPIVEWSGIQSMVWIVDKWSSIQITIWKANCYRTSEHRTISPLFGRLFE